MKTFLGLPNIKNNLQFELCMVFEPWSITFVDKKIRSNLKYIFVNFTNKKK